MNDQSAQIERTLMEIRNALDSTASMLEVMHGQLRHVIGGAIVDNIELAEQRCVAASILASILVDELRPYLAPARTPTSFDELLSKALDLYPHAEAHEHDGEIVIYTGLTEQPDGALVPHTLKHPLSTRTGDGSES